MSKSSDIFTAHINMYIPETHFKDLEKGTHTVKNVVKKLLTLENYMPRQEFYRQTSTLYKCCLKIVRDKHELHKRRVMGMEILDEIILRADSEYITIDHVIHLTWAIMSCIHHFQLRLKTGAKGLVHYSRKRKVDKCMKTYSKLIRLFQPKMHMVILNSILTFYKEGKLWEIEFSCRDLIVDLLYIYQDAGDAVIYILDHIERVARTDIIAAKYLVQVLSQTLNKVRWEHMSRSLMGRLLYMLESSIEPKNTDKFSYIPLRNGLQLCVRNSIKNLRNVDLLGLINICLMRLNGFVKKKVNFETITCLSNIAAYAASKYTMKTFSKTLTSGFMISLIEFIQSQSLFGVRIWRNLFDRNNNATVLSTPKIFYISCNYNIVVKKCMPSDKLFFKSIVTMAYETTIHGFRKAEQISELELIFQAIAVTLVEIPCGYSASTYMMMLMDVQEYAHEISHENFVKSHYIHAIVLSLMSLICYIHKADVFYNYVNTILDRRARWAPHLNPPLQATYSYAQHHVLWNKPDFFFEHWEARYGLWKCFRVKKRYKRKHTVRS